MPTQDEMNDEAQLGYIAQKIFIRHLMRWGDKEKAAQGAFKAAEAFITERKSRWEALNGR